MSGQGGPRQLETLSDESINRERSRMEGNRLSSLASGQGGMKERIKKEKRRDGSKVKNVGAYTLVKVIGSCVNEAGYTARRKE